ncbi:MAG TPA: hypothetical protein VFZ09_12915 [Archangium sp.]|uniref:hypothetical protein n=1 Tax=Archangium sp. TaxID=1872627 RepID=UPI002E33498D|nr:hypothetical protein [Archangium sp.]HEX5747137.1 hypothetical protein [Archangium sp.]
MLPSLRSRNMFQPLSRVCCGLLSALLVLSAPAAEAAPKKKSAKSSRTSASKPAAAEPAAQPAAAEPAAAEPAPAAEVKAAPAAPVETKAAEEPPRPARESKQVAEARPAPAQKAAASRSAAKETSKEAPLVSGPMRIGVSPDLYLEGARMTGVQYINTARLDESFDYSAGFLSITAWLSAPVSSVSERLRLGAGVRVFGNYAASGGQQFGFGIYNEAFVSGEYGLPVADKTEVVFAGRAGLSLLIPGLEFAETINRLQTQGVSVWSVPRVGWLLGPSVGARRRMSDSIWLRADLLGQIGQQYLFATSQEISGFNYSKTWSTLGLRLGLSLGAEFSL